MSVGVAEPTVEEVMRDQAASQWLKSARAQRSNAIRWMR